MKIITLVFSVFLFLNCSSNGNSNNNGGQPDNCPSVTLGSGAPSASADWVYDFTQQSQQLDTSIWTPEVTMSGEGNFEFEAYVNSAQTLTIDSANGLTITAGQMKDYLLQTGQTFALSDASSSLAVGSSLPIASILGCNRTGLTDSSPNNLGNTCSPNWQLNFLSTCTDDGTSVAFPYGCQQGSGFGGAGIGAGVPSLAATPTTPVVPPVTQPAAAGTIVPPVISARISTKLAQKPVSGYDVSKGFLYGRLEIVAKIPKGDWLWPAIWMMPLNNTTSTLPTVPANIQGGLSRGPINKGRPAGVGYYGLWPRSGEIDILESRGNKADCAETYMNANINSAFGGVQSYASTLHWGPYYTQNAFDKTHTEFYTDKGYASGSATAETLDSQYHIYGLRWSPKGIYTYIDNDSNHVLEVSFENQDFYTRGTSQTSACLQTYQKGTPSLMPNCQTTVTRAASEGGSWPDNPWARSTCTANAAPFDRPFYLIINMAIGGTAGEGKTAYFPDGYCQKPWHNPINANDTWSYPVANFFSAINSANSFSGGTTAYSGWFPSWTQPSLQVKTIKYWTEPNAGAFGVLKHPS